MRVLSSLILAVLVATPAAAERRSPEEELARELRGRVAGEPVDCIELTRIRGTRIIDGTAIVYDAGSIVYVNHPRGGAESLTRWDTLVTRTSLSRLCSPETVQLLDSGSQMFKGFVSLGPFIPYRRTRGTSD